MEKACEGCDAAVLRLPCTAAQRLGNSIIKKNIPYAVEIVFDAYDGAKTAEKFIDKILWHLIDRKMRFICNHANGVSCVTQFYLQNRYFSLRQNNFTSYYSSAGLPKTFFTGGRKYPQGKNMTIGHVDLQIGLHSRKGTDEVLKAVSLLKRKGIIVNISFAGDDWDNNAQKIKNYACKLGIGDQVSFPGYLTMSQMSDFLESVDLFVFPTKAEGLPRSVIEAMSKGLPVVTTPVSGNPELINDHFLVNYEDVDTLADRIEELITNKDSYEGASYINFQKSLEYEASVLEKRRDSFYKKLKSII